MGQQYLGIEIISIANMLRRVAFQDPQESDETKPTGTQQWVLVFLWEHLHGDDVFQKDLEENFQIRSSTATEILKGMERKGLISRQTVSYDRRAKKIVMTEKALKVCEQNMQTILAIEEKLSEGFTADELHVLFKLMGRVKTNIECMEIREP